MDVLGAATLTWYIAEVDPNTPQSFSLQSCLPIFFNFFANFEQPWRAADDCPGCLSFGVEGGSLAL